MSENTPPARPVLTGRIPSPFIWAFGIVMLAGLISLPFIIFKIMALTQNQAQGMTLAGAAELPIPSQGMRCTVRETRDKSVVAARYELAPATVAAVLDRLKTPRKPDPAFFADLAKLSPHETAWQPAAESPGPWHTASGFSGGRAWRAALDASAGVLWIHSARSDNR